MGRPDVVVSDHAVLRWIERVAGIDVAELRRRIASDVRPFLDAGACSAAIGGVRFMLDPKTRAVVTVITEGKMREEPKRRRSPRDFREGGE
ncbi:hypothetical protein [Xanthobacter flavus]|uniref:hypothetical protein n=1 Tax=Xanthobacter flavus TaxID=281 RepID=UPI003726FD8F